MMNTFPGVHFLLEMACDAAGNYKPWDIPQGNAAVEALDS